MSYSLLVKGRDDKYILLKQKKEPVSSLGFNNYPQKGNLTKDKGIYNKIMNQVKHLPFSQKKKKKKNIYFQIAQPVKSLIVE